MSPRRSPGERESHPSGSLSRLGARAHPHDSGQGRFERQVALETVRRLEDPRLVMVALRNISRTQAEIGDTAAAEQLALGRRAPFQQARGAKTFTSASARLRLHRGRLVKRRSAAGCTAGGGPGGRFGMLVFRTPRLACGVGPRAGPGGEHGRCHEHAGGKHDSSFRGLQETIEAKGLFCSFYTDRGSHYFVTPKAGGKVDKERPTQVGRALSQLGIEHIPSYSPQARGRVERLFGSSRTVCRKSSDWPGSATSRRPTATSARSSCWPSTAPPATSGPPTQVHRTGSDFLVAIRRSRRETGAYGPGSDGAGHHGKGRRSCGRHQTGARLRRELRLEPDRGGMAHCR